MTKRKSFIRSGHVGRHYVMFFGNFALPWAFGLSLLIALGGGALIFGLAVNSIVGVDPVLRNTTNLIIVVAAVLYGLYWLIRGIIRLIRTTLAINGGRIES